MFHGTIMNWRSLREQYDILIHLRAHLIDEEKLAYLCHSLQHSPAKHVIEGLLGTESEYSESIECRQECYDGPHVLHHAHVQAILEAL